MQEMQETHVWSLDGKDPLEEGMATHASIPRAEEPGGHSPGGRKELDATEQLST